MWEETSLPQVKRKFLSVIKEIKRRVVHGYKTVSVRLVMAFCHSYEFRDVLSHHTLSFLPPFKTHHSIKNMCELIKSVLLKFSPLRLLFATGPTDLQAAAPSECILGAMLDTARRDEWQHLCVNTTSACFQYGFNEAVTQARRDSRLVLLLAQVVPWSV